MLFSVECHVVDISAVVHPPTYPAALLVLCLLSSVPESAGAAPTLICPFVLSRAVPLYGARYTDPLKECSEILSYHWATRRPFE